MWYAEYYDDVLQDFVDECFEEEDDCVNWCLLRGVDCYSIVYPTGDEELKRLFAVLRSYVIYGES